ncbi:DEAD/DEAH box helicase [Treponema sp. OMZ 840]|uniref:DEAD/DEAH box helicase n=1 Tax=Treponema sp. OMZ 840 TaxID=244313 RepID=UPI003D937F7D
MERSSFDIRIAEKLNEKAITVPTPVQKDVIPLIYEGVNCLFESETGTGKTLAYLLPLIQRLCFDADDTDETLRQTKLLIAAPTKELASQIKAELNYFIPEGGKTLLCFGGSPLKRQIEGLKEKPFAVIGSPNRLLELIRLKKIKTAQVEAVVFDEADRLLSKEMSDESTVLLESLPAHVQFCACSATLPLHIQSRLTELLEETGIAEGKRTQIRILPKENILTEQITHWAFYTENRDKNDTLRRFLAAENPEKALIFCINAEQTEHTAEYLSFKHVDCFALHARTDKIKRKQALDKFKSGSCKVLVTSDLAARGLDIKGITHVIQMGLSENPDFFVHRAGRTGRSGNTGINVVIGDESDLHLLAQFEKKFGLIIYPKDLYEGKVVSADDC